MAFHFTQDRNSSADGYNVKQLDALKTISPGNKLTALVAKDKAKDFDFDFDHYDLFGCTKPPALHEQRLGIKHRKLCPDVDCFVDRYVGFKECEKSREEVPVSVDIDKDMELFDAFAKYEASHVPDMRFLLGPLSSKLHDNLVDILHKIDSLNSRPVPKRSVTSVPQPQYTMISPKYSPILPKPRK